VTVASRVRGRVRSVVRRSSRPYLRVGPARPVGRSEISPEEQAKVDDFHRVYFETRNDAQRTLNVNWLGYRATKCPLDLWTYQEIVVETRPELIVEAGTRLGGTSVFLATIFDLLGVPGRVVTIDTIFDKRFPKHPRIEYLTGSSHDQDIVDRVHAAAAGKRTMLILDSLHTAEHVGRELELYADIVSPGCYLVVEDMNVNGHPVLPDYGPGPTEAVEAFLETTDEFVVDRDRERFLMTLNPGGYLRRVR
jgi:cephalosporin hydroxylase